MKTCVSLVALVACGWLSWTSCVNGQSAQERFEIQGKVTVHGTVIKMGNDFGVQARTLDFVLDHLSRTDARLLNELVGKGITVKGTLRTKDVAGVPVLVIDLSEFKAGGDGFLNAKVEGEVEIRGLLTKDLPHHGDYRIPHNLKPNAFLLNRVSHRTFSPVLFSGDVASKAEGLYGRNVTMRCRLEVYGLGSRSECMIFTLQHVQLANQ